MKAAAEAVAKDKILSEWFGIHSTPALKPAHALKEASAQICVCKCFGKRAMAVPKLSAAKYEDPGLSHNLNAAFIQRFSEFCPTFIQGL